MWLKKKVANSAGEKVCSGRKNSGLLSGAVCSEQVSDGVRKFFLKYSTVSCVFSSFAITFCQSSVMVCIEMVQVSERFHNDLQYEQSLTSYFDMLQA